MNPGTPEAIAAGCTCSVIDNAHGKGLPWPRVDRKDPNEHPSFWITAGCPVHHRADGGQRDE